MDKKNQACPEVVKILSIGNSFSVDTMEHVANIALSLGCKQVKLGNLYVGGCSLNHHFYHAQGDLGAYKYYTNDGTGWQVTEGYKISDAVRSEQWDWISIQHGTKDGSRYTLAESYEKLPALIAHVKALAWSGAKIAFNMTWIGEPYDKHEIVLFGGDQLKMYGEVTRITQQVVLPTAGLDRVSPTGTAIQNARTSVLNGKLSRDGYHLSLDAGRYIAGLTFWKALTGADIADVAWAPEGVDAIAKQIAVESAENAIITPFAVTPSKVVTE